jgi:hypothetical protein
MIVNNKLVFEHKIEERSYSMTMDLNSPLGEAYQAAGIFLDEIIRLINEHAQKRADAEKVDAEKTKEDEKVSE